jgi:hypothetical protein
MERQEFKDVITLLGILVVAEAALLGILNFVHLILS